MLRPAEAHAIPDVLHKREGTNVDFGLVDLEMDGVTRHDEGPILNKGKR